MAPSRVVRQRKLGVKTSQQVLLEDEIDSAEYRTLLSSFNSSESSTGVEKSRVPTPSISIILLTFFTGAKKRHVVQIYF
jgi:hypothetical protein